MESFIESYGLRFTDFQQKAMEADAYVAGSSALALFLTLNGKEAGFTPSDIDMYFRGGDNTQIIREFLIENGFEASGKFESNEECPYTDACIRTVESYMNDAQQEIQLITLDKSHNVIEYIVCEFDLSICATWWIPAQNEFKTFDEANTLKKNMYIMCPYTEDFRLTGTLGKKQKERLAKYSARGFTCLLYTSDAADE